MMPQASIGDLAQTFQFRRQTTQLKSSLNDLTSELASGRASDLADKVSGDFAPLAAIESSLTRLEAFDKSRSEATLSVRTIQASLETIEGQAGDLAPELLGAGAGTSREALSALAAKASSHLESGLSVLNTSAAGRHVFSGRRTDRAAINVAEISKARDSVANLTSADDIIQGLDGWFGANGQFENDAYKGSPDAAEPVSVGAHARAGTDITADDPAIRQVLKGYVAASLIDSPGLDKSQQSELAQRAGKILTEANDLLIERSAEAGVVQARLDEAETHNAAERTSLQAARNEIVTVDPYETAIKLKETRTQLQTLFSATARISNLSLTNYLR